MEGNFEKYDQTQIQHLANYDYGEYCKLVSARQVREQLINVFSSFIILFEASVMHYEPYAFAVDPSVPTIIVPSGVIIGKTDGFSEVRKQLEKIKNNRTRRMKILKNTVNNK